MDARLTRRRLLGAGVGGSVAALAGCSSALGSDTEPASIHRLLVENHTTAEHTVHLQLLDGGEVSYWCSVRVPVTADEPVIEAHDEEENDVVITGTKLAPGFPLAAGEYTLLARLDADADWRRVDFTDVSVLDGTCLEIVVTIEDETTLGFLQSVDEAVCGKQSAPS